MRIVAGPRAVDLSSSHQFDGEIGDASSENGLFMAKMEFSVRTPGRASRSDCLRKIISFAIGHVALLLKACRPQVLRRSLAAWRAM